MKTLKNKIFAGALALATLGIFGEKNANAQDADSLSRDSVKINFECWEGEGIEANFQMKTLPCFNGYKVPEIIIAKLNKEDSKTKIEYSFSPIEKRYDLSKSECKGDELLIASSNQNAKGRISEVFAVCYESGTIGYSRYLNKRGEIVPIVKQKTLTTQDIHEKFGEGFANRTKEIINARGDSLKMTNLLKKEYEMGKLINENGEIEKVVHQFY